MEQVKLLSMTFVLTAVIWMAADSLVNETVTVPVTFDVYAPSDQPDLFVTLADDTETVQIQVVGPHQEIARIQSANPLKIGLTIPDSPTGVLQLPVEDLIKDQWKEYARLSVISVRPPKLPVIVDRIVSEKVRVTAQALTLTYTVQPEIRPSAVMVRLRESRLKEFSRNSGELPPLDISTEVERLLRQRPPGEDVVVTVSLDAQLYGPNATIKPDYLDVRAMVAAQRSTAVISTVPILLASSFANFQKPFKAVTREGSELVTQTIKVTGPTTEVNKLKRGELRAYGFIQLKDEHFSQAGTFLLLTPDYQLPAEIELAEKPKPIELKIEKQEFSARLP